MNFSKEWFLKGGMNVEFTFDEYRRMVGTLILNGYEISNFENYRDYKKTCVLRHDIDCSLKMAADFSDFEQDCIAGENITSTFYVLLTSNFYNAHSKRSREYMKRILSNGSKIGLHFDERAYDIQNIESLVCFAEKEAEILSNLIEERVTSVSMHCPSKLVIDSDIKFNGMCNAYSTEFFKDFKYVSDSSMHWREDVFGIIKSNVFDRLQILTHAFWYSERPERIETKLNRFIETSQKERHSQLQGEFPDLEVMKTLSLGVNS